MILQLRSVSHQEREDAAEKLKDISTPALAAIRTASEGGDLDFRRLSGKVLKYLEQIRAVRAVNGVEFRLVADSVWTIPAPGKEAAVRIELSITNRTNEKLKFNLLSTFWFGLVNRDGDPVLGACGATNGGLMYPNILKAAPVVEAGQTHRISNFDAHLLWEEKDLRLYGDDGFGTPWCFHHLHPGKYLLFLRYRDDVAGVSRGVKFWTGQTGTNTVVVELSEQ